VKAVLMVSARDNVATALEALEVGRQLEVEGHALIVREAVPAGHKVAMTAIPNGSSVIKYGNEIGRATADIPAGTHVHTHNVASSRGRGDLDAAPAGQAWSRE
jgi:altronate dehydratase